MARLLNRIQIFAALFAIILLVTSGHSEEKGEPKVASKKCWRNSETWPHPRCFHSAVCNHYCQSVENALSGQCGFFFKKCQCKYCDEDPFSG
ncbi:unnamed protein product [Trifolium pratense]|uniref:Uncharacterized protein n=1 Tax=Trifolium pratense TaxID=57577 RepID=A0ACB0JGD4_TRIPR|nr:unnamed protein product [Trifolium pratense]